MNDKEYLRKTLPDLGMVLYPFLSVSARKVLSVFSIMAQGYGSLEIETTEGEIARWAETSRSAASCGVAWLVRAGFITKDAPRGRGKKLYRFELGALQAAAYNLRVENREFYARLEAVGAIAPMPPVRKRKRPVAA